METVANITIDTVITLQNIAHDIHITSTLPKQSLFNPISIASCIIALLALAISLYQSYLNRRNFYLSLTPKLTFTKRKTNLEPLFGLSLRNVGLGPAIIDSITYYFNNCEMHNCSECGQKITNEHDFSLTACDTTKGHIIQAKEDYFLLSGSTKDMSPEDVLKISKDIDNIQMVVTYHSIAEPNKKHVVDLQKEFA